MVNFKYFTEQDIQQLTTLREGETKLGEVIHVGLNNDAKYAIIGLPESNGVKENNGVRGTETLWPEFLKSFCNIQSTDSLPGSNITIFGNIEVTEANNVVEIDSLVSQLVLKILEAGKLPIIIGGGHNNAYGNIKACHDFFNESINVINLDPHADFRRLERRHSGNGFSHAMNDGLLHKYAVVALHRNYNAQSMLDTMDQNKSIHYSFYEDIFVEGKITFQIAIGDALAFTNDRPYGIEIDLDSIEYSLSSAMTPCGLQSREVRQFTHLCAQNRAPVYIHICEGATRLENGRENPLMGKLVSYLVSDFVRSGTSSFDY